MLPEPVQTMGCGRAECLSGLTFSSCDSHKSNVTRFLRCVPAERQENVLCPQTSMKAEQVQSRLRAANSLLFTWARKLAAALSVSAVRSGQLVLVLSALCSC